MERLVGDVAQSLGKLSLMKYEGKQENLFVSVL